MMLSDACDLLVFVPYRDRAEHLAAFVPHMCRFLSEKRWRLCLLEQTPGAPFNRGKLFNAGVRLFGDLAEHYCFHDVDMLPEDGSCDYTPTSGPAHLSGCASQNNYKLPYPTWVGGVVMVPRAVYFAVNGFGNEFWGYGKEDNEFGDRLVRAGYTIARRPGRYCSLPHPKLRHVDRTVRRWKQYERRQYLPEDDGLAQVQFTELARTHPRPPAPPDFMRVTLDLRYPEKL